MKQKLKLQAQFISTLRDFFTSRGFTDVLTPPMVDCPGIEPTIQPFRVSGRNHSRYLHTSPEFWMKYLLSEGWEKIFTITYCFRDEPCSPTNRTQFLMLEWYRTESHYLDMVHDLEELTENLIQKFAPRVTKEKISLQQITVQELFSRHLGMDILELAESSVLKKYIQTHHPDIPLPTCDLPWDDYYHLLFLNKIEPLLKDYPYLILKEYPEKLRALSRLKVSNPLVCERFEYYIHGLEVANCYGELTDLPEQKKCFYYFNQKAGGSLPTPKVLFHALKKGLPKSAGIALGIERLMQALLNIESPFFTEERSLSDEF